MRVVIWIEVALLLLVRLFFDPEASVTTYLAALKARVEG